MQQLFGYLVPTVMLIYLVRRIYIIAKIRFEQIQNEKKAQAK